MDSKEQELYQEEQRHLIKELISGISELKKEFKAHREAYKAPESHVSVDGEVKITNPQKDIAVTNLDGIEKGLETFADKLESAIKNIPKPKSEVSVKNIKDAKADTVEVSNLKDLYGAFKELADVFKDNRPEVIVQKEEVRFPTSPTKPLPVRLSDGKRFYEAIMNFSNSVNGLPTVISTETGERVLAVANADGSLISGGGATTDGAFDFMDGNDLEDMGGTDLDFMSG